MYKKLSIIIMAIVILSVAPVFGESHNLPDIKDFKIDISRNKNTDNYSEMIGNKARLSIILKDSAVGMEGNLSKSDDIPKWKIDISNVLEKYGCNIELNYGKVWQALIPLDSINKVRNLDFVERVEDISYPIVQAVSINVEGVRYIKAGNPGSCDIAVIDMEFENWNVNTLVSPYVVETKDFSGAGFTNPGEGSHGVACAEIIAATLPGVKLHLYKVYTPAQLETAVIWAKQNNVRIISHSVSWFNYSFYDGTGTINEIANRAVDSGIVWVNSAGNYAKRHYHGVGFTDIDGNGVMEFPSGAEYLPVYLHEGKQYNFYMNWNSYGNTVGKDLDLYLFLLGSGVVDFSTNNQQSGAFISPTEGISYVPLVSGWYGIAIVNWTYIDTGNYFIPSGIHIFSTGAEIENFFGLPSDRVSAMSLTDPATAEKVITVGATYWNPSSYGLEDFSSRGPTSDGRQKPDVIGPDGTSSLIYGYSSGNRNLDRNLGRSFFGTSASAPYVAGVAGYILSRHPGYSPPMVKRGITMGATSLGYSKYEQGWGLVNGIGGESTVRLKAMPQIIKILEKNKQKNN